MAARLVNSIAQELDSRLHNFIAQGKKRSEALEAVVEASIENVDSLADRVLDLKKPAGVMSLKKYMDFYRKNKDGLNEELNDRFVTSMARFSTALIAYTSSSRSRGRTITHLGELGDSLKTKDKSELTDELMPILQQSPDFTRLGTDQRQYKQLRINEVQKVLGGFSRGE